MACIALASLALLIAGAPPAVDAGRTVEVKGAHLSAECPAALKAYAAALVRKGDTDWEGYRDVYGLRLPEAIRLRIRLVPERGPRYASLWTDGKQSIFLDVGSAQALQAPAKSGVHNVYGIGHELGHIAFYWRMARPSGFPEGVAEGWAHYFGSVMATRAYPLLGASLWPDPHNYDEDAGLPRLDRQIAESSRTGRWDPTVRTAAVLRDAERKLGAKALGAAVDRVLATRPTGSNFGPRLVQQIVHDTGDRACAALFPPEMLQSATKVTTRQPDITQKGLYAGLKLDYAGEVLTLRYDDGRRTGQRSLGGTGQVVCFRRPEGAWSLTGVDLFASRYGSSSAPPDASATVYLCDEGFRVLAETVLPYSRFARADEWRWERAAFPATAVPAFFYVALDLGSGPSEGLYLGLAGASGPVHSRVGLPGVELRDMGVPGDWMVRCRLSPSDAAQAPNQVRWLHEETEALRPAAP